MTAIPGLVFLHFQNQTKLVPATKMHDSFAMVEQYIHTQFPETRGSRSLELRVDIGERRDVVVTPEAWARFADAQMEGTGPQVTAYTILEVSEVPLFASTQTQNGEPSADAPAGDFEIVVMRLSGEAHRIAVTPSETVGDIKRRMQGETSIPVEEQRLLFGGKEIRGRETVQACGLRAGSTIYLLLRNQGKRRVVYKDE
ncbi:p-loop containing nucleoside triphosphate hydrolase protein [Mycena kentingensis (nom. inval.)]|nr:p-loop containing nucleoside triphosphate hydrolase protein [Mycena kentingensis (nom. inval.)]